MAQAKGLHLQCRCNQGRNVLDENFTCDIETTECTSLDQVAWIVEATRIDREDFIFADIHVRSKKVQKHVPCAKEPLLVDAGEESSEVLVVQLEMAMFWSLSKDGQEVVDITRCKVVGEGNRNQLEEQPSQDVEHGAEGCIHKGDDGSTTLVVLLLLGKNVAGWQLAALSHSPWIGLVVLTGQLGNQCRRDDIRSVMYLAKDIRIQKGAFNGLAIEARAEDSQR